MAANHLPESQHEAEHLQRGLYVLRLGLEERVGQQRALVVPVAMVLGGGWQAHSKVIVGAGPVNAIEVVA